MDVDMKDANIGSTGTPATTTGKHLYSSSAYHSWDSAPSTPHEDNHEHHNYQHLSPKDDVEMEPTLYVNAIQTSNLYLLDEPMPKKPSPVAPKTAGGAIPLDSEGGRYSDPRLIAEEEAQQMDIDNGYIPNVIPEDEVLVKAGAYGVQTNLYIAPQSNTNYLTVNEDQQQQQAVAATPAAKKKTEEEEKASKALEEVQGLDARKLKEAMVRVVMKQQAGNDTQSPISITDLLNEYKLIQALMDTTPVADKKLVEVVVDTPKEKPEKDPFNTIGNREWNKEFQAIRTELLKLMQVKKGPMESDSQMRAVLEKVEKLTGDFYYAAKCYARIIISELCLPESQKTIPPVKVGGLAGGEKYIVKGILFKFALDQLITEKPRKLWMYGGTERNDRLAIKAAGKEFTALQIFIALANGKLSYPLMALIDYKGFRMIATILLPIDKTTLIYGSNDSGRTVHSSVPAVNHMMAELGDNLHLKGHFVGTSQEKAKYIYGPGDIEVHQGKDGNFYALDFGRLLPPEAPVEDPELIPYEKRSVFYKFLRPEFLIIHCANRPLSSDSFSAWSNCDKEKLKNEANLREATKELYDSVVPSFASDLEAVEVDFNIPSYEEYKEHIFMKVRLTARARCNGLNVRHLGKVRSLINSEIHRKLILSNCVARVLKRVIRDEMRIVMNNMMGTPTDRPFRMTVANIFNMILGHEKDKSEAFWFHDVKVYLKTMFHYILSDEEKSIEFDLRQRIDMRTVIIETLEKTNIILTHQANSELMSSLYGNATTGSGNNFVMIISDILELAPKVRQLYSNYMYLSRLTRLAALETDNKDTAMRLLTSAYNLGVEATLSVPKCPVTNLELSYVLICIISKQVSQYSLLLERQPIAYDNVNRLKQDIEKNFDVAFARCEESMATVPASENFKHWVNLAVHFANWKKIIEENEYVDVFLAKSEEVANMTSHLNTEVACYLEKKDITLQYKGIGGTLTMFRANEEEKYRAAHPPLPLSSPQAKWSAGVPLCKKSGVVRHRPRPMGKGNHHPVLGVASYRNFKLQDV